MPANRGTSSKSARFFRHWRRFADFPDAPSCCSFMLRVGGDAHIAPPGCGFVGADNSVRPGPITQRLVGQGPCALPWVQEKIGRADVGIGPYGGLQGVR